MRGNSNFVQIKNYTIYYRETMRGWAIVIMPDEVRIDNCHGFPHLHYTLNGKHVPISTNTLTKALQKVLEYLSENDQLKIEDLKNKLGG